MVRPLPPRKELFAASLNKSINISKLFLVLLERDMTSMIDAILSGPDGDRWLTAHRKNILIKKCIKILDYLVFNGSSYLI